MDREESQRWADGKEQKRQATQRRMRELPVVRGALNAAGGDTPHVLLECPKGHPISEVQLFEDHRGDLSVAEVGEPLRLRRDVAARAADPLTTARPRPSSTVCAEPDCPRIVTDGAQTCPEHGSMHANVFEGSRVQIVCAECTARSGIGKVRPITVTQSRLLEMYTVALLTESPVMRV